MTSLSQDEEERNASKLQVTKVLGIGSESSGVEGRWSKWGGEQSYIDGGLLAQAFA